MVTLGRAALWQQGRDEVVEVNQRALIDKVLARYSGEFTVFRELLQNADDAHATAAEIRFDTEQHLTQQEQGGKTELMSEQGVATSTSVVTPSRKPDLPDLKKAHVDQWTFRNNGMPFRNEDWNRLKKIAEGNPDEEKIGAFGVGFYSLFSVTEEPFVKSGAEWMGFYWRNGGNQLFARRGDLPVEPNSAPNEWTSFEMPLRESAPLPGLPVDIARFLATSLTFMTHLRNVSMYFDGWCLARIEKEVGSPRNLSIPKGLKVTSPSGMMSATGMTSTSLDMKAIVPRWVYDAGTDKKPPPSDGFAKPAPATLFFSPLPSPFTPTAPSPMSMSASPEPEKDPLEAIVTSARLSIFAAQISVRLNKSLSAELERATKKKPAANLTYQMIYTGKDEYDASEKGDEEESRNTGGVFRGLRADLDGTGHAHGHATAQTTGMGGHVAARFIPTVERESIDLVDRNVSQWNKELLYVGGLLARAVYEIELNNISELWSGALSGTSPDDETAKTTKAWLQSRCLHVLQFFTFHPSTPSPVVSEVFRTAFFVSDATSGLPFRIISTLGIRSARDVRVYNEAFTGFLKNTPMVPPEMARDGRLMLRALQARGMCTDVTFQDVVNELKARILDEQEVVALLKWHMGLDAGLARKHRATFLGAAGFCIKEEKNDKAIVDRVIRLAAIQTYVNPRSKLIPLDSPLPNHTLPFAIGEQLGDADLNELFGWTELSVPEWIKHLINPATRKETGIDITLDTVFAEHVLNILARAWPSLDAKQQEDVYANLSGVPCIPTKAGLKIPDEAYFANTHVFPDLPIITMSKEMATELEQVLVALGVRRHVDLQIVFNRMIDTGDWTAAQLMEYLVDIRSALSGSDVERLKHMAAFVCEGETELSEGNGMSNSTPKRHVARDLYEPTDTLRNLGLPTLFWSEQVEWLSNSEGAEFMFELGLKRHPSIETVLGLAGSQDTDKCGKALKYFVDNRRSLYASYDANAFKHVSFVPAVKPDGTAFFTNPIAIYSNPECAVMGFDVVAPTLDSETILRLEIKKDPPTEVLLTKLLGTPPRDQTLSGKYCEYLSSRIADFTSAELTRMSDTAFICAAQPTIAPNGNVILTPKLLKPTQVYLSGPNSHDNRRFALFPFIDFGPKAATFLRAVGVKEEPNTQDICAMIMENPTAFKDVVGGYEQYLAELRCIGAQVSALPSAIQKSMANSPMLLGMRQVGKLFTRSPKENQGSEASDDTEIQYELLCAKDILIVDDMHLQSFFGYKIWGAPQEDSVKRFYKSLGSKRMRSLVHMEYSHTPSRKSHRERAETMQALVLNRLPLFLHEFTHMDSLIKPEWLANNSNFKVVVVKELQVTYHLHYGSGYSATQQVSAGAIHQEVQGPIILWLAENLQTDLYEVADSLCGVVFKHCHKINDSLLFMTILSTDLGVLKERGYDVDRVLNSQRMEQAQAKAAQLQQEREQMKAHDASTHAAAASTQRESNAGPKVQGAPRGTASGTSSSLQERLSKETSKHGTKTLLVPPGAAKPPPNLKLYSSILSKPLTSPEMIEENVQMAIAACHPDNKSLLCNRQHMAMVKESLNESYCNIGGSADSFVLAGEFVGYKVYMAKDILDPGSLTMQQLDIITRFGNLVVTPLRTIYHLPVSSINIFYETRGNLIAYNCKGSLFLNLRYYKGWHDNLVKAGSPQKALIYWYFVLAHQIAHNLVQHHNAEHEFYLSSLAEFHMPGFLVLLSRP